MKNKKKKMQNTLGTVEPKNSRVKPASLTTLPGDFNDIHHTRKDITLVVLIFTFYILR